MSEFLHTCALLIQPFLAIIGGITVLLLVTMVITHLIWGDKP